MEYFDFSKNDSRVFIPKCRHQRVKQKGGFVNHNFISAIKSAPSLDRYAEESKKREAQEETN